MSQVKKLTPNLVVSDVVRSLAFYTEVLGFERGMTVPEKPPFVFASATTGAVEVFLNDRLAAIEEYPAFAGRPIGGTLTLFIEVDGVDELYDRFRSRAPIVMPLVTKWYGMKEFAIADPDGYVITFAERVHG